MPDSFYVLDDDRYVPTEWTIGPWDQVSQHGGPPAALLGRAFDLLPAPAAMRIARFTMEILRPVPIRPLALEARTARPGKRVQLCEGVLRDDDGDIVRATAWRLAIADEPVPEIGIDPLPHALPPAGLEFHVPEGWWGGYLAAMEVRFVEGHFLTPGPAVAWMRMRMPLLPDEEPSPLTRVLCAADSGNGISSELDLRTHVFVNTDLSVHLVRAPSGEWVCLESVTRIDPDGIGLTETAFWDERTRLGRGAQALYVRAR